MGKQVLMLFHITIFGLVLHISSCTVLNPKVRSLRTSVTRTRRQTCSGSLFSCGSGECIDVTLQCDGATDCSDGSDETEVLCRERRCPPYAFRCSYGACVDADAKCNGSPQCADNSDETLEECSLVSQKCSNGDFHCGDGSCISSISLCDGAKDCSNGADETTDKCSSIRCPPYSFRCSYGGCIDGDGRCNGKVECADGSDESSQICVVQPTEGCILPNQPEHGSYKVGGCQESDFSPLCRTVPGTIMQGSGLLLYQCDANYKLAGSGFVFCSNGQWSNPYPTCEPVLCPALQSNTMDIVCSYKGQKVPCIRAMAPGTEAVLSCRDPFRLVSEPGYNRIHCLQNGQWDKPLFTCLPICGRKNPEGKTFVSNGEVAKVGEFPWHVGIYKMQSSGDLAQVCGGSLVSENVVVTAAHCFWSEPQGAPYPKDNYKIAAGKYYRDWNIKDLEMQEREVKELILHDEYRGRVTFFQNDIAVVRLNVSLQLTWAVLPICLDVAGEYKRFQLAPGNSGSVAGWGITENNEPSNELITANLPYVPFSTCFDTVPATFKPFITRDKFCAGYQNGTSVCPGDSGGGLAFPYEDRWYLQGIVSVGARSRTGAKCVVGQYTAFTEVSEFLPWLRQYIN